MRLATLAAPDRVFMRGYEKAAACSQQIQLADWLHAIKQHIVCQLVRGADANLLEVDEFS